MSHSKKGAPSVRMLRVNETLRHELASVFMREDLHNPVLDEASITVSEVRTSPDLRTAKVFVMPLGGAHKEEVLEALNHAAPYLTGLVGRRVHLKFSPKLSFVLDTSFDESRHIDELLHSPKVARDLKRGD